VHGAQKTSTDVAAAHEHFAGTFKCLLLLIFIARRESVGRQTALFEVRPDGKLGNFDFFNRFALTLFVGCPLQNHPKA
jgi:hypothetical protein